jgi:signal transduction histidine kinase
VFLGGVDSKQYAHLRIVEFGNGLCGQVAKRRHFKKRIGFRNQTTRSRQRAIADQVALAFDRIKLLREVAQSNQKLLAVNAELRRAHAEMEQIAFSASHELREPVRHLSIYAELLEMRLKLLPEDVEARRFLQFVLSTQNVWNCYFLICSSTPELAGRAPLRECLTRVSLSKRFVQDCEP